MLNDWTIQARTDHCDLSGEPFAEGQPFYTLLYRDRQDGLSRRDVSEAAWRQLRADPQAKRPFSFWRSKFTPPPPPAPETLAKADAETLLRHYLTANRPEHRQVIYILALMLERKRLLRPTDVQPDPSGGSGRLLFYEHAKTGESFVVGDPGLRLDQLEDVQREVGTLLKHGEVPEPVRSSEEAATSSPTGSTEGGTANNA
jgi:hypothetical protein